MTLGAASSSSVKSRRTTRFSIHGRALQMDEPLGLSTCLEICKFGTLSPSPYCNYHVLTPNQSFRVLRFTSDSFNLIDVVSHGMRMWSPSALVRKTVEEEAGTDDQAAILLVTEGRFASFQSSKIRSTVPHQVYPAVFAGNYDGDVLVYNSDDGCLTSTLYSHQNAIVKCLAVTKGNILASGDINGIVQVWQLDASNPTDIKADKLKFDAQFSAAICQILFDGGRKVSTYLNHRLGPCLRRPSQPGRWLARLPLGPTSDPFGDGWPYYTQSLAPLPSTSQCYLAVSWYNTPSRPSLRKLTKVISRLISRSMKGLSKLGSIPPWLTWRQ